MASKTTPSSPKLKGHYLPFGLLVAGGLIASSLLAPGNYELGQIFIKTHQLDKGSELYQEMVDQGNYSPTVTVPLAKVYLRQGSVDQAIKVLELSDNIDDPKVLTELANAYRDDQRHYDQLYALQDLAEKYPTEANLKQLSQHLNFLGELNEQADVLQRLQKLAPTKPEYANDLSDVHMALGQSDQAMAALETLRDNAGTNTLKPKHFDRMVNLLLHQNKADEAYQWADTALQQEHDKRLTQLENYTDAFTKRRHWPQAQALLATHGQLASQSSELHNQYLDALIEAGNNAEAYKQFQKLSRTGALTSEQRISYIGLAFDNKDYETAFTQANKLEKKEKPDWLKSALVYALLDGHMQDHKNTVFAELDQDWKQAHPLLAARIALQQNELNQAETWLDIANQNPQDNSIKADIIDLYLRLGRPKKALPLMESMVNIQTPSKDQLSYIAQLYLDLNKIDNGITFFETVRTQAPSPQAEHSWAKLAAAKGKKSDITDWLTTPAANNLKENQLLELYYAAADRRHYQTALAIAEHQHRQEKSQPSALLLANAQLNTGRRTQALATLKPYRGRGITAIDKLWKQLTIDVWQPGQPVTPEILAHWQQQLNKPTLSDKNRRNIAFQLLEAGYKQKATDIFQQLAEGKTADHQDVNQLLFLWGPLPEAQKLAWIKSQAVQASPRQRSAWLHKLSLAGGQHHSVEVLQSQTRLNSADQQLLLTDLNTLFEQKRLPATKYDRSILGLAKAYPSVRRFEQLYRVAIDRNRVRLANKLLEMTLERDKDHRIAQRELGLYAWEQKDHHRANRLLGEYNQATPNNWRTLYYQAESLSALQEKQKARPLYETVIGLSEKAKPLNQEQKIAYAQSLYQTRRWPIAKKIYKELHETYPANTDIRADYVGLLIDSGETRLARQVLEGAQP